MSQAGLDLADLQAVLFDFDGTLVYQVIDFAEMRRRVVELAVGAGFDIAGHQTRYTLEFMERAYGELLARDRERAEAFLRQAQAAIIDVELEAAAQSYVFAGASDLLRGLRARGVKVGIVTRNCRLAVEAILAREPLEHDILLTRDDVARVKPDPEHLWVAIRALGVSAERTLMVGDHPLDVQAGRAVGAWTIGILNDGRPVDYFAEAEPDAVLRSVAEIPAHLGAGLVSQTSGA